MVLEHDNYGYVFDIHAISQCLSRINNQKSNIKDTFYVIYVWFLKNLRKNIRKRKLIGKIEENKKKIEQLMNYFYFTPSNLLYLF